MHNITNYLNRWVTVAVAALLLPAGFAGVASAATVPYAATFSATAVNGTINATTSMTSSLPTFVTSGGICATGADGIQYVFPKKSNFTLTGTPTTFTTSRVVPTGQVYTYWTCLLINGSWTQAPGSKGIFVAAPLTAGADTSVPVGNLPNLTQTFREDFTRSVGGGAFANAYAAKWTTYNGFTDTSGLGTYDNNAMSVHDGVLDENLSRTSDGVIHVAALGPVVTTKWTGQVYGRFSVRFKADALAGFKTAFLLWPDSNIWNDGEVDFPEGPLNGTMWGYNHCPGNPTHNCAYTNTGVSQGSGFHTFTIDWKPDSLTYIIDGRISATTTTNIPTKPMHWVLQTEANGAPVTGSGHLLIDWATVYSYTAATVYSYSSGGYVPTGPARVLDTRNGTGAPRAAVAAGTAVSVPVLGVDGVPASKVSAVVVNVTVTQPTAGGYLTVYPAGASRPTASNLNFNPGQTVPNLVVVPVGADGRINLYNGSAGTTELIGDIAGFYLSGPPPAAGGYVPTGPARVLDTRNGTGAPRAAVAARTAVSVPVLGVDGVPASKVSAVVVNVTVTQPTAGGYLTVYPAGASRPTASNLNFNPGQTVPNLVVVPVGADGRINLYNGSAGTTELIGDIAGFYLSGPPPAAGGYVPTGPARVLDTRNGTGAPRAAVAAGTAVSVPVLGVDGVPASKVSAVVVNVTVTQPTAGGYLTVYPAGASRPTASNLNFNPGQTVPNLVVVPVGADGRINLYNGSAGTTELIGDIAGYFVGPAT